MEQCIPVNDQACRHLHGMKNRGHVVSGSSIALSGDTA